MGSSFLRKCCIYVHPLENDLMPKFSALSQKRLLTCHTDLRIICEQLIKITDFTIICGHRGKEDQEKAFRLGRSKLRWPKGKHNKMPSEAIDIAPYPTDWNDHLAFNELANYFMDIARNSNIKIKWGGDFKTLKDLGHFELI